MAGPLSSERPVAGANLTGGDGTSTWHEANQDFRQVMRTAYMDRPARTGTFSLSNGARARNVDQ